MEGLKVRDDGHADDDFFKSGFFFVVMTDGHLHFG